MLAYVVSYAATTHASGHIEPGYRADHGSWSPSQFGHNQPQRLILNSGRSSMPSIHANKLGANCGTPRLGVIGAWKSVTLISAKAAITGLRSVFTPPFCAAESRVRKETPPGGRG
jgi:hypothetical protein